MTVTETSPSTTTRVELEPEAPGGGFASVLGSGDHKTIGRLYLLTSLLFLLVAAGAGGALGVERINLTDLDVLDNETFAQVFTLHSVSGFFLVLIPALLGVALVVTPLQVGSPTIAFPRAAAASYWTFLVSGALVIAAYLINGGPFGGDSDGVDLFLTSFGAVLVALLLGWVCVATTVIALRAPGLAIHRVPLFSWSSLVTAAVALLTLPVAVAVVVLLYVDHRYFRQFAGGNYFIYGHLQWVFEQPSIYLVGIPVLGFAGDVIPVFAQTRHLQHRIAMTAIGAFGALAVGAWAQPGFELTATAAGGPRPYLDEGPWLAFGLLALAPLLVLLALWAGTIRQGKLKLGAPLIYAAAAFIVLFEGAAAGALNVIPDLELAGTTWTSGQTHAVSVASLIAVIGAMTYWAPKLWGRLLPENGSRLAATVVLIGAVVLSVTDLISGALDQIAGVQGSVANADNLDTVEALNLGAAAGGALIVLGVVVFLALLARAAIGGADAPGDDPWDGHTLEWATASPPSVGNFATVPEITSEAPLYDARHAAATED